MSPATGKTPPARHGRRLPPMLDTARRQPAMLPAAARRVSPLNPQHRPIQNNYMP